MEKFVFLFSVDKSLAVLEAKDNCVLSTGSIDIIRFNNFVMIQEGLLLGFASHKKYPDTNRVMLQVRKYFEELRRIDFR